MTCNLATRFVLAALPSIALVAMGCGRVVNRTAESKIREALPTYIGRARQWQVRVDNPQERTLQGRLRRLIIDGDDVLLKQMIRCDELHIEMRDVNVDVGRGQLKSVRETTFRAVISVGSLNEYIRKMPRNPDNPLKIQRVEVRTGSVRMEALREVLRVDVPFTITAEPRLVPAANRLEFDADKMTVVGLPVPLPSRALRFLAQYVDAGFNFSTLPFPLRITTVRAEEDRVVLTGTADVMESLNRKIGLFLPSRTLYAGPPPAVAGTDSGIAVEEE